MKKNIIFIILASALVFSSCVKNLENEGVTIDNVTHFSYGGYLYQVHHDLGLMSWGTAYDACTNLVAYGYDDWFMPSMGEMQAAHAAGLTWVQGWTSTYSRQGDHSPYYYCFYDYYTLDFHSTGAFEHYPICPMRKKQLLNN